MTKKQYIEPQVMYQSVVMKVTLLAGSVEDPIESLSVGTTGIGGALPGDAL